MLFVFIIICLLLLRIHFFFFFNDTATTEIYTLSLHDALPICWHISSTGHVEHLGRTPVQTCLDRKSTRLNSSHQIISYAVFCLKKKNKNEMTLKPTNITKKQKKEDKINAVT